jgi:TrmH family RNA methyltransferase
MPASPTLTSRANPLYKRLRALKERGTDGDLCLLEGPTLVVEALAASVAVLEAAASPRAEATPTGALALARLRERGVPVLRMTAPLLQSLSETETSPGLVAVARRPAFDEARIFRGTPLVLVVEGVQNPGNLGGLLRTAEAAGATGALLAAGTADPFSWKALRGSMGSAFRLPLRAGLSTEEALDAALARGLAVFATAAGGERRYDETDLRGPTALVVGSESRGLSPAALRRAKARLRVPLASPVESLNVGVAAALVLFEAARQRGFASPPARG